MIVVSLIYNPVIIKFMVAFLLVKSHEIYEISGNLSKSVKFLEIRVNSTDFEIRRPFWGVGDPSTTIRTCIHQVRTLCTLMQLVPEYCTLYTS